jgi:ribonucleoside-triphosphate reductase
LTDNLDIVVQLIQFIYENIMYAELNTKSDYCCVCGYDKEIKIITDGETGELVWECPRCGNRDESKMSVARRTCGYIGTNFWNKGRTQEIKERVLHIDDKPLKESEVE